MIGRPLLRRSVAISTALLALAFAARPVAAEDFDVPAADGWYSWQVAASRIGARSCCYGWHAGQPLARRACDLDGRGGGYSISGDCEFDPADLRVYVRMQDGRPERVRALNADCPVTTATEITDLGVVDADASVRWLAGRLTSAGDGSTEILAAIPMHAGDAPHDTLTGLLEDGGQPTKIREQALFWLVQTESDEAFAYVDRLLTGG